MKDYTKATEAFYKHRQLKEDLTWPEVASIIEFYQDLTASLVHEREKEREKRIELSRKLMKEANSD